MLALWALIADLLALTGVGCLLARPTPKMVIGKSAVKSDWPAPGSGDLHPHRHHPTA
jgi:hypothetical protein